MNDDPNISPAVRRLINQRLEQGLPERVEDPAVLRAIAGLLISAGKTPPPTPVARVASLIEETSQ